MEDNKVFKASDGTLASPELAQQFQDIICYFEKTPFSKAFPNKYRASMEHIVLERTFTLFKESPTISLKNVVTTILNGLNDELPDELVTIMTQVIIQEWKRLSDTISVSNKVEEMV